VRIGSVEPAFARAVEEWGFCSSAGGLEWTGEVAGADRLRFLGMLSRYAGILSAVDLREGSD
jgi:ABC-2 type transport system ATP-binding protein